VYDSRVIAEYLETLPAAPRLIPEDPAARIAVRRWEALADGVSDAAASIFLEYNRRTPAQQSPDWIARQQLKISRGLLAMNSELGAGRWCMDNAFSLADIAVGSTLGYLDLRFSELGWKHSHPPLRDLQRRLEQRPSFQATQPPPT